MGRCADLMEKRRGEIVDWVIREAGSTRIKADIEWQMLHAITLEAASFPHRVAGRVLPINEPGKESRVYRQPIGVIAVISPWNFPIYLAQRSVGPAIALGNSVVLKPSQDTPITGGLLLAKIFEEAGVPEGVLNVVVGASSEIGDAFVKHPVPRLVSFTGSTAVGRHVAAQAVTSPLIKHLALELGHLGVGDHVAEGHRDAALHAAGRARLLGQGDRGRGRSEPEIGVAQWDLGQQRGALARQLHWPPRRRADRPRLPHPQHRLQRHADEDAQLRRGRLPPLRQPRRLPVG